MTRNIPLRYLLTVCLMLVGVIPLLILSLLSFDAAKEQLKVAAFNQLESVRQIKRHQVINYYHQLSGHLRYLADDQQLLDEKALQRFCSTHHVENIYILDANSGSILLSAKQDPIVHSKQNEKLIEIWKRVKENGPFVLSDTSLYSSAFATPVQFMAGAIYRQQQLKAVLVARLSLEPIDQIMRERSGMGKTGETYLVGSDYRMRSDSYLDPLGHSVMASLAGSIEKNGGKTKASIAALKGEEGRSIVIDYNGNPVLSSYGPIDLYGLRWAILAEIDEAEIDQTIEQALNSKIISIIILSLMMLLLLALAIALLVERGMTKTLKEIEKLFDRIIHSKKSTEDKNLSIEADDLPYDFREMASKLNQLIHTYRGHLQEKEKLEQLSFYNQRLESIGSMAGTISHDFNNILTYMYTYVDGIIDDSKNVPEINSKAHDLILAIDHATALTEQIAKFIKNMKHEMFPISLKQAVSDSVRFMLPTFQKRIAVNMQMPAVDLLVMADPTMIHQIMLNLCTNAYQALLHQGGSLDISLQAGDDHDAVLTIHDNGPGIPVEIQSKVFDPFFSTKMDNGGCGMGLTIVERLVKRLNGRIHFSSSAKQGTSFVITIPLLEPSVKD